MEVTFTRTAALSCEAIARRDDGRSFLISHRLARPVAHDLAHFAVEHELGWQTGFWGYVARGAVFPSMRQLGGRRPPHADERSRAVLAAASDLLGEAEVLTTAVIQIVAGDLDGNRGEVKRVFADSWWPPKSHAERLPYADVLRACVALRRAKAEWQGLDVGEGLTYLWSLRPGEHTPPSPVRPAPGKRARASFARRGIARR